MVDDEQFTTEVATLVENIISNDTIYCVMFGLADKTKLTNEQYVFRAGSSVLYRHELDLSNVIELTTIVYCAIRNMEALEDKDTLGVIVVMDKETAELNGVLKESLFMSSRLH